MMKYQVYCDRGNGLELNGCWGSENGQFETKTEAQQAIEHLKRIYPNVAFIIAPKENK